VVRGDEGALRIIPSILPQGTGDTSPEEIKNTRKYELTILLSTKYEVGTCNSRGQACGQRFTWATCRILNLNHVDKFQAFIFDPIFFFSFIPSFQIACATWREVLHQSLFPPGPPQPHAGASRIRSPDSIMPRLAGGSRLPFGSSAEARLVAGSSCQGF